jgi:hypothetical protein
MLAQNFNAIENLAGVPVSLKFGTPAGIIVGLLPYLFGIAGIILILNIIVSGYQMMTSAGEPKVMQVAQAKITTSLIGIVIIFISFWLVSLIMKFLGINLAAPIIK